jgi:DNA-binding response OmpR family regulator
MAKRKTAMVVDDEPFFGNLVGRLLLQLDFNSVVCNRFEQALDMADQSEVDLVVADIFMPGIGGIEGIRRLKQNNPNITVIAMSGGWAGMSAEDTIKAARKIGADGGLQKPFTAEKMRQL